jgi:hypothetical protein
MSKQKKKRKPIARYQVMWGEMGSQEIYDTVGKRSFDGGGEAERLVNELIAELNRLDREWGDYLTERLADRIKKSRE